MTTTAMKASYTVRLVDEKHRGALPPIALSSEAGPFSFTDYLSDEQAMRLAAMLTQAAMEVREADVLVEAEEPRVEIVESIHKPGSWRAVHADVSD